MDKSSSKEAVVSMLNGSCIDANQKCNLVSGVVDHDDEPFMIPIIDYSMLLSSHPDQITKAIAQLSRACLQFGFFIVINHGIPDELIKSVMDGFKDFFDQPEQDKKVNMKNNPTDTIRWGIGNQNHVSREFIKFTSHPTFHFPPKPPGFSEILEDYSIRMREVGRGLLKGISKTLGLNEDYIEKKMMLIDSGYDFYTANDYPPRKQAENRIGQLPHTDPSLLILLVQNVGGGLQLNHRGRWLDASNLPPHSIIVSVADHLEILTNGKYKSAVHQVVVDNEERRVTLPLFMGPALDVVVGPAPELTDDHPPAFMEMTYEDYLRANQFHVIDGKSCLNQIRL